LDRHLHALAHGFPWLLDLRCALVAFRATAFTLDSLPVPVCKGVRARRNKKVRGHGYHGYCAAKEEYFFGWRLHLRCSETGVPVGFEVLPPSFHDLPPLYDLAQYVPASACIDGDKAYNSGEIEAWLDGEWGVRLVPVRKQNMEPNSLVDRAELRRQRAMSEGVNSQLAA